ncbi:hypothetical protein PLICRDRAFT_120425, partial [Plicaturopsis crispa FD-325 SS-3]
ALRIWQLGKSPQDIEKAAESLKAARFRSKAQFERKFERRLKRDTYKPGDLVLARNPRFEKRHDTKHLPRYFGPYKVHRRNRGGAYILKELDGTIIKEKFAAFRLYPYYRRNDPIWKKLAAEDEYDESSNSDIVKRPSDRSRASKTSSVG